MKYITWYMNFIVTKQIKVYSFYSELLGENCVKEIITKKIILYFFNYPVRHTTENILVINRSMLIISFYQIRYLYLYL